MVEVEVTGNIIPAEVEVTVEADHNLRGRGAIITPHRVTGVIITGEGDRSNNVQILG